MRLSLVYSLKVAVSGLRSLAYSLADIRDQRHCEHPTSASRVTPRAVSSYSIPFHVFEVLKPGTQWKVLLPCAVVGARKLTAGAQP